MGISERTARRWIKSGKLRAYKPGRDYWIPESALRELVEESEVHPKAERRSSLEPSFNDVLEDERRESVYRPAVPLADAPRDAGRQEGVRVGLGEEPEEGLASIALPHDSLRTPELLLERLHEHGIRTNRSEVSVLCRIIGMSDELVEDEPVDHERVGWLLAAATLFGLLTKEETKVARETAHSWLVGAQR